MARRRKASKGGGIAGLAFFVSIGVVLYVYQLVQQYFAGFLLLLGSGTVFWIAWKWRRWSHQRGAEKAPAAILTHPVLGSPPRSRATPSTSRAQAARPLPIPAPTSVSGTTATSATARTSWNPFVSRDGQLPRSEAAKQRSATSPDAYSGPGIRITALTDPLQTASGPPSKAPARWVPSGEAVSIEDLTIEFGMFYLGAPTRSSSRADYAPPFVDLTLKVARTRSSKSDPPTYYPSYSKLTPSQRRGFLTWMAEGRVDPEENLSLVFLFFYGLEHRLFKEGAAADAPQLIAEVERLLSVYGGNRSFHHYARYFLMFAKAYWPGSTALTVDLDVIPREMPLDAKIYLGAKLASRRNIDASDALIWAVSSPTIWHRRWPNDQADVFEYLWRRRFAARFPEGLPVQLQKATIAAVYRPASRSFESALRGAFEKLPDPAADSLVPLELKSLVDECWAEGGSLTGSAARRREAQSPAAAAVTLPQEVWIKRNRPLLQTLSDRLATAEADTLFVPVIEVFKAMEITAGVAPKTLLSILSRISDGLLTMRVGMEPDGNYPEAELSFTSNICLFKIPKSIPGIELSRAINIGARLAVDIGILCASLTDNADPETRARISAVVADGVEADQLEKTRLEAYASIATACPDREPRLRRSASQLPSQLRQTASRAAIAGVTTNKRLSAQVVRRLERIHIALNVPLDALYAALHRATAEGPPSVGDTDPSNVAFEAVRQALEGDSTKAPASGLSIDKIRLARARKETDAVSKMLSDVFTEGGPSSEDPRRAVATEGSHPQAAVGSFAGLDFKHGELLATLLDAGSLSRNDVEARTKSMKLFADAALDHINDWALEHFEELAIEVGDVIRIAPHLADRVRSMRNH
jgi:hypothetical protein